MGRLWGVLWGAVVILGERMRGCVQRRAAHAERHAVGRHDLPAARLRDGE
jgi:hypothetical protein